jgi:endonuclease/exonuclease/phosphatase family metal-dependent hydrolase
MTKLVLLLMTVACNAETLRVMTFNVRYPAKGDGANVWEARRDLLVETIRSRHPDLVGTQELFQLQGDYIVAKLSDYAWFGLGRRGDHTDEHMGVFYRKDRLELVDSGNFWLSETPETPGSMAWGADLPRMVTWGDFKDKQTGQTFRYMNTHFPHRRNDEQARTNCAKLIVERAKAVPEGRAVILTGDFNTGMDSEAHRALTTALTDTWDPDAKGPTGTFHGFRGTPGRDRIDWILFRGALIPKSIETITDHQGGVYPSDHFPVLAVFETR